LPIEGRKDFPERFFVGVVGEEALTPERLTDGFRRWFRRQMCDEFIDFGVLDVEEMGGDQGRVRRPCPRRAGEKRGEFGDNGFVA